MILNFTLCIFYYIVLYYTIWICKEGGVAL